jgi:hypothetical protein
MNNPTLLNFGDSWAWGQAGDACQAPKRYSVQVASSLGFELLDFSQPATSCANMILQFKKFVSTQYRKDKSYKALFFVTAKERQLFFQENGQQKELWPEKDKTYYVDYYNDHLGNFTLNTSIMTLQALCSHYNIDDYYLLGWQMPLLWPEVNTTKFYNQGRTNALSLFTGDTTTQLTQCSPEQLRYFMLNDLHPSDLGHTRIAEVLVDWMQNK